MKLKKQKRKENKKKQTAELQQLQNDPKKDMSINDPTKVGENIMSQEDIKNKYNLNALTDKNGDNSEKDKNQEDKSKNCNANSNSKNCAKIRKCKEARKEVKKDYERKLRLEMSMKTSLQLFALIFYAKILSELQYPIFFA